MPSHTLRSGYSCLFALLLSAPYAALAQPRWTPEQANAWHQRAGWLIGCNFLPSTAINQLEMWQAETFDLPTIDRELGWAAGLGFNSVRVFLHHIPWEQDREGYLKRIDQFLAVAHKHKIGVMFVHFDSVWDPHPKPGKQREPKPGVHNSGWVQCPGAEVLKDPQRSARLEDYVKGIINRYKNDPRVHVWDIWNEPDNLNPGSYGHQELPNKLALTLPLLKKSLQWARECDPGQPITAGVWHGDWSEAKLSDFARVQLENSDIITFHAYANLERTKQMVEPLKRFGRPILCTEYVARPLGSTFQEILPYFKEHRIGAYNWGFVAGKSNTIYAWDTWQKPVAGEPKVWFHDIFRADGTPFDVKEVEFIRETTER